MIVNSAYMYMIAAAKKFKNLWDGPTINYRYQITNGADTFDYQGDHWRIYNASTGSRIITFYGVNLTEINELILEYANGPKPNNANLTFLSNTGQKLGSVTLPASQSKKAITIPIPALAKIEKCIIQIGSGIAQNFLNLYTATFN